MPERHDALTYGTNVVTTVLDGRRYGMTCSWATQVDYDRVLLVLGEQSATRKAILASKAFGLSVLSAGQKALALHFGEGHSDTTDKFAGIEVRTGRMGMPLIPGSLKMLECAVEEGTRLGDEDVLVGRIVHFERTGAPGPPLLLDDIDAV